jgi:hypothetical protein
MGVSEGKLLYAEVTREEPFVLSSFVLDNDSGTWTLEHRMELNRLWVRGARARPKDAPHIAVVDPLNASVMHIAISATLLLQSTWTRRRCLGAQRHR